MAEWQTKVGRVRRGLALLALVTLAVLVAACTNVPAPGAVPSTVAPKHPGPGSVTPSKTISSALPPAKCQSRWVLNDSDSLNPDARKGLSAELVPPGPGVMTVCRYAGLNQKVSDGTLEASRVVSGPALAAFVRYVDQKNWQVIQKGVAINCPMSQGSVDLLELVYPSGPELRLSVDIAGCSLVSNGIFTVWGDQIGARVGTWVGTDPIPQA